MRREPTPKPISPARARWSAGRQSTASPAGPRIRLRRRSYSLRSDGRPERPFWEEAYWILDGDIRFSVDGRTIETTPGTFVVVPPGVVHTYRVTSPAARLLVWSSPARLDAFLEDLAREITEIPPDFSKVLAIAARHEVEAVLPPA